MTCVVYDIFIRSSYWRSYSGSPPLISSISATSFVSTSGFVARTYASHAPVIDGPLKPFERCISTWSRIVS